MNDPKSFIMQSDLENNTCFLYTKETKKERVCVFVQLLL